VKFGDLVDYGIEELLKFRN